MSEINNNNESTEQSVEESIEETGGVPEISVSLEVSGMTQTAVDKTLSIEDMAADAKATGDAIANVADDLLDLAADVGAIEDWTGEDIDVSTTDSTSIAEAIGSLEANVGEIQEWTGEDIPVSSEDERTIAEAISDAFASTYPVGTVYMTTEDTLPESIQAVGTWVEIRVPLTWNDIKTGSRSFEEVGVGFTSGTLHFWRRVE